MKLLESAKSKVAKNKNGENVPNLETAEVVLVHGDIVNDNYQQSLRALYAFVLDKSFGQLLDIPPKNFTFSKTFGSEFSYIEIWFTGQNSRPLGRKLLIKVQYIKMSHYSVQPKYQIFVKGYGFFVYC